MTENDSSLTKSLDDPRLRAFFPLLYVAWADGDLSPGETREICARVESTEGLDLGCGDHLAAGWTPITRPRRATCGRC